MDLDEEAVAEMHTEAEVLQFSAILAEAQAIVVKLEREAMGLKPKRKHHYTGNAPCTIHHYALKHRKLATTGQKLITIMIMIEEPKNNHAEEQEGGNIGLENKGDGDESSDNDIEKGFQHIFSVEKAQSQESTAAWVNWKYHGHRILPLSVTKELKKVFYKKYGRDTT
ncbi:hypothetical protein C0995_003439 [Termitomyces sp. Mi166|nr:hypothetical protein C0995_003439 [Termitomyces sp. Mi166\